jgi:hypothetical protein
MGRQDPEVRSSSTYFSGAFHTWINEYGIFQRADVCCVDDGDVLFKRILL